LCYLSLTRNLLAVPTDAEITFRDHAGRFYARRYGMARGCRLLGYLGICDPREQSIAELPRRCWPAGARLPVAVNTLDTLGLIRRSCGLRRRDGPHLDRHDQCPVDGFDVTEYQEQGDLAREGLALLADEPLARRAVLLEWAAFADFLVRGCRSWRRTGKPTVSRCAPLVKLPDPPSHH